MKNQMMKIYHLKKITQINNNKNKKNFTLIIINVKQSINKSNNAYTTTKSENNKSNTLSWC